LKGHKPQQQRRKVCLRRLPLQAFTSACQLLPAEEEEEILKE